MKLRIRNKAYDCAHHVYKDFLVTDDPYPILNTEDYCKLGKYDNTWTPPDKKVSLCKNCKRYCASRPMIRKKREFKARMKELIREEEKAYREAVKAGVSQKDYEDYKNTNLDSLFNSML